MVTVVSDGGPVVSPARASKRAYACWYNSRYESRSVIGSVCCAWLNDAPAYLVACLALGRDCSSPLANSYCVPTAVVSKYDSPSVFRSCGLPGIVGCRERDVAIYLGERPTLASCLFM